MQDVEDFFFNYIVQLRYSQRTYTHFYEHKYANSTSMSRIYIIDKWKISEADDKWEYRIYRNSIGDREKKLGKILEKKILLLHSNEYIFLLNHII
jgi:hypothetical protein